jgi:hypothetical protein
MDYSLFSNFFHSNQHLFNKYKNVNTGTNHADNIEKLKEFYKVEFPYGHCFPISQFMFYYLGGYGSDYELRCIHKIPMNIGGYEFFTSHWFVQNKLTSEIIDLSKEQFDKILDISKYYKYSRKANFGFPYFFKNGGKRYINTVPSKQVIRLYEEFRKIRIYLLKDSSLLDIKSETLEFYLKEYKDGI